MVSVDDVVSHQVLLVVVIEVVVSDQLRVDVVDEVIAVVDDGLIDKYVISVVDQLLRVSILSVGCLCDNRGVCVLEGLLLTRQSNWWSSDSGHWCDSSDWSSDGGGSERTGHVDSRDI